MRKHTIRYIIAAGQLMVLLLCTVPMAGQSANNLPASDNYTVEQVFDQSNLSTAQLNAFEDRAKMLVYEFVDYYNLLRQKELDAEMKAILLEEVKKMFFEEETLVMLPESIDLATVTARDFALLPKLTITDVHKVEQKGSPKGEVWTFTVNLNEKERIATVRTILSRQLKSFGTTQRLVWDVLLLSWETR